MYIYNKISSKKLEYLIFNNDFLNSINLPISYKRAISYLKNPRAEENLPLLCTILSEKELISYLGVFQDWFLSSSNQTINTGWFSSAWTHPQFRRKKLLNTLIEEHYKDYNGHLFITNYGADSEKMFQKSGLFTIFKYLDGRRFYYRLNLSELLPPKHPAFQRAKSFLKFVDLIGNFVLDFRFLFYKRYRNPNIQPTEFNKELEDFISKHNQNSLFKRNIIEFKWILDLPWVEQKDEEDGLDKKYHFTTSAKRFYQKAFILKSDNKIKGFIFYAVKNEVMKVHYVFYDSDKEVEEFSKFISNELRKEKISYVLMTDKKLIQSMKNKGGYLFSKIWKKGFFAGNQLLKDYPEIKEKEIYMGDGDSVFT